MKRMLYFAYGIGSYLLFLAIFAYMAGFVGDFLVPKSIDSTPTESVGGAVAVDLLLLGLFAAQHSIMARPAFKRIWTRVVPQAIERSTYVFLSCVVTAVLMWQWRSIDMVVWDVQEPVLRLAAWALFGVGWLLVPGVTLLIDHFDLFGVRQVWLHFVGKEYSSPRFQAALFYRHVRHPLYIGWAIAFWATPTMTVGHLLFALMLTVYMAAAAVVEERDLVAHFGPSYEDYRRRVPMFVPQLKPFTVSALHTGEPQEAVSPALGSETCGA